MASSSHFEMLTYGFELELCTGNIVHLFFIQRFPLLLQEGQSCHLQGE